MVKVRGGMKSTATKHTTSSYAQHLCQRTKKGVVLFCSTPSRIESGKYIVLLTAVARQCSIWRTLILKKKINEEDAENILKKWVKILPIDDIN